MTRRGPCMNCSPGCPAIAVDTGKLRYHVLDTAPLTSFRDHQTSIQPMGSTCPNPSCRCPQPKIKKKSSINQL